MFDLQTDLKTKLVKTLADRRAKCCQITAAKDHIKALKAQLAGGQLVLEKLADKSSRTKADNRVAMVAAE